MHGLDNNYRVTFTANRRPFRSRGVLREDGCLMIRQRMLHYCQQL